MPTYQAPGIYIEEIPAGSRPIEAVGTSTAGFVGTAPKADAHLNEAFAVNSWSQFVREFAADNSKSTILSQAVFGFFQNGGSRCYIVNVGKDGSLLGDGKQRQGLALLEEIDEVAIVAAPGFSDAGSYDALLEHCERMQDRFVILDAPERVTNIDLLKKVATVGVSKPRNPEGEETTPDTGSGSGGSSSSNDSGGLRPRNSDTRFRGFLFSVDRRYRSLFTEGNGCRSAVGTSCRNLRPHRRHTRSSQSTG